MALHWLLLMWIAWIVLCELPHQCFYGVHAVILALPSLTMHELLTLLTSCDISSIFVINSGSEQVQWHTILARTQVKLRPLCILYILTPFPTSISSIQTIDLYTYFCRGVGHLMYHCRQLFVTDKMHKRVCLFTLFFLIGHCLHRQYQGVKINIFKKNMYFFKFLSNLVINFVQILILG